jgi:uncharacterized protein YlxP (DUF503 family)
VTRPLQVSHPARLQGPAASLRVAGGRRVRIFTGSLTADLLLGDVHSLKEKRAVVKPIVAELRRRFAVAAAEVGDADLHRRAQVGVATVAGQAAQVTDVLDACERLLADRPEVTLLSTHRQLHSDSD